MSFKAAQVRRQEGHQGGTSTTTIKRCKKPLEGYIKTNWDAARHEEAKEMGIGVIVWDCEGEMLALLFVKKK